MRRHRGGKPSTTRSTGRVGRYVMCALLVVVCATATVPTAAHAEPEGFNKAMLSFNRWMLRHVLEPVARGYNFVTPKWGQRRVGAFFENLLGPRDIINSALQAKFQRAGTHTGRFLVNSTIGVAGFFDVGLDWFGWDAPPETFDETLGTWGAPLGPYLILPFFGDSSPRHIVGLIGDGVANPIFWIVPIYVPTGVPVAVGVGQFTLRGGNLLASQMPSPRASDAEWDAYHRGKFDFPRYEIGRENFIADEADRVAE